MPVPRANKTPTTVEEFIAGAEEWGDTEIFSDATLREFARRMMDASDDDDCTFEIKLSRTKKITLAVYNPSFDKSDKMSDILAGDRSPSTDY